MKHESVDPHQDVLTNQQLRHARDQGRCQSGASRHGVGVWWRQAGLGVAGRER